MKGGGLSGVNKFVLMYISGKFEIFNGGKSNVKKFEVV